VAIKNLIYDALTISEGGKGPASTAIAKAIPADVEPAQVQAFIEQWTAKGLSLPGSVPAFMPNFTKWQASQITPESLRARPHHDDVVKLIRNTKPNSAHNATDTAKLAYLSDLLSIASDYGLSILGDALAASAIHGNAGAAAYVRKVAQGMQDRAQAASGPIFNPDELSQAHKDLLADDRVSDYLTAKFGGDYSQAPMGDIRKILGRIAKMGLTAFYQSRGVSDNGQPEPIQ
jgi:hypothetical protein